jgi:hypothetical protein
VRRFAFRLALALGEPNPDAMLARMPNRVFKEWVAFAEVEPFGEERADMRAAIVAATIANVNRKKGKAPYKVRDFMPVFERRRQTWQEQLRVVEMLNMAFGGRDLRKK